MQARFSRSSLMVLAAALMAGPALAGSLIVKSAGPSSKSYPPGKQLPETSTLQLRAGDSITLLGPGSTRTIRGPGTFSAGGGDQGALSANRRARFGALRSGELSVNPSPWNVDVSQSGKACVAGSSKPSLWRPSAAESATLAITGSGGRQADVKWDAGKATTAWPGDLPLEDGATYQMQLAGGDIATIEIATLDGEISDDVQEAAQALIERGCDRQLQVLVNAVAKKSAD